MHPSYGVVHFFHITLPKCNETGINYYLAFSSEHTCYCVLSNDLQLKLRILFPIHSPFGSYLSCLGVNLEDTSGKFRGVIEAERETITNCVIQVRVGISS